jgi:hypothetical protein
MKKKRGVASHSHGRFRGGQTTAMGHWGGSATPRPTLNFILFYFIFFFGPWTLALIFYFSLWPLSHPKPAMSHPLGQNGNGRPPIW